MTMSREQQDEQTKAYSRIVARAWSDDAFKQRLLADPAAVLQEEGVAVPAGMAVHIHEADAATLHLVLPAKPTGLSDEQLDAVAGGFCIPCVFTR